MGYSIVQHASTSTTGLVWPQATTPGNCLIGIGIFCGSGTPSSVAISDGGHESWTQVGSTILNTGENIALFMFVANNCVGGVQNTVSASQTGMTPSSNGCIILEVSGLSTSTDPHDGFNGTQGTGTNQDPGAITVSADNELVIALGCNFGDSGQTWTPPTASTGTFATLESQDAVTFYLATATLDGGDNNGHFGYKTSGSHGWAAMAVSFTLGGSAPTVSAEQGISYGSTIEVLSAAVNPNGAATSASFNYGATAGYGSSTSVVALGSGSSPVTVQLPITGLTLGNTYHFQCVAANSIGGTNGSDATFTTLATPQFSGILGQGELGAGILGFNAGGSGAFTQTLTAALTFAGALIKQTAYPLSGALTLAGSIAKSTAYPITAALSFTGTMAKKTLAVLVAILSCSGAFVGRSISAVLSATLTATGSINRTMTRAISATLSFAGSITKSRPVSLTAALSFVGTMGPRAMTRALTAALSLAGTLNRSMNRMLTASISFAGTTTKQTARAITAVLSYSATVVRVVGVALSGSVSFTGSITKQTAQAFTGAMSFAGSIAKQSCKAISSALALVGNLASQHGGVISQALSASLSFTGNLAKQTATPLAAALSFTSNLVKQTNRVLTAVLTFAGILSGVRLIVRVLSASLSLTSSMAKQSAVTLAAALSLMVSTSKRVARSLAAAAALVGGLVASYLPLSMKVLFAGIVHPFSRQGRDNLVARLGGSSPSSASGRSSPSSKSGLVDPQ